MPVNAAEQAIRSHAQEIAQRVDASDRGRAARSQAGLEGASHITAILVPKAEFGADGNSVSFEAVVELYDHAGRQYEARVRGLFDRAAGGPPDWRIREVEVVDASPLPAGG